MIYSRYHAQWAAKIAAEREVMRRELAEIRGEVPAPVDTAEPQPTAAVPQQQQVQQHRHDNQKRR